MKTRFIILFLVIAFIAICITLLLNEGVSARTSTLGTFFSKDETNSTELAQAQSRRRESAPPNEPRKTGPAPQLKAPSVSDDAPNIFLPSFVTEEKEEDSQLAQTIDVPHIELGPEDLEASKKIKSLNSSPWAMDPEYAQILQGPWNSTKALASQTTFTGMSSYNLLSGVDYDKIVDVTQNNLKGMDRSNPSPSVSLNGGAYLRYYRLNLLTLSVALECQGNYAKASRVRKFLYSGHESEADWFDLRKDYALSVAKQKEDPSSTTHVYESICSYVHSQACRIPIERLVTSAAPDSFEQANDNLNDVGPYSSPEERQALFRAYVVRSECAKIVNPRLYYSGLQTEGQIAVMTQKSYARFMEFMERQYELKRQEAANASKEEEEAMSFLRKLGELPN